MRNALNTAPTTLHTNYNNVDFATSSPRIVKNFCFLEKLNNIYSGKDVKYVFVVDKQKAPYRQMHWLHLFTNKQ